MSKVKGAVLAIGAAALTLVPAGAAFADTTIGGQEATVGPCDVKAAEVVIDQYGQIRRVTVGWVNC